MHNGRSAFLVATSLHYSVAHYIRRYPDVFDSQPGKQSEGKDPATGSIQIRFRQGKHPPRRSDILGPEDRQELL